MNEAVKLTSADGLRLEAELSAPERPRGAVVLCHPHPKMGGTMNAPLLRALRDALVGHDWAVLRFNFRGIGHSEGEPGDGIPEVADAEGALGEIERRYSERPHAIAGWSFGGAVSLRAATSCDVAACIAIAPAVNAKPGVTAGLPPPDELALDVPSLFVCGANDDVVSPEDCRRYAEEIDGATFKEIAAANHFFWAKYDELAAVINGWLNETIRA